MKIVMLNTSDRKGGAAVAAYRLREALVANGVETTMIVRDKTTEDPDIISINTGWRRRQINRFRFLWERLMIFCRNGFTRKELFAVSIADTGTDISRLPAVREADVIHLHWINQGFLSLKDIRKLLALGKPVVWTLHDMWPVTGICHHAWECGKYKETCGACPFLHSTKRRDLSTRVQRKKAEVYHSGLHLIPVSEWLAGKCRESALGKSLPVTRIPNSIDTELFSPGDRSEAREKLGLPSDKKILLMGAARIDDPVKGFPLLKEILTVLPPEIQKEGLLVLFGELKEVRLQDEGLALPFLHLGTVSDPGILADLYRAADATLSTSHYETFGQTLSEALSCGCPVVSFDNGGQKDIVDHRKNGYLARYADVRDFARGIEWILCHPEPAALAENARKKVFDTFAVEKVAAQYIRLYESLSPLGSK